MARIEKFYQFMSRSSFNRRIVGTLLAFILIGGVYIVGTGVFNTIEDSLERQRIAQEIQKVKDADPKEYVNFYSVKVDDTPVGDAPNLTLCRKLGHGTVKIDAVRTFIRYENGQQKQVAERGFKAAIEQSITNTDCTTVDLQGQPQVAGKYRIFTDYCFNVDIHGQSVKKCDNYLSNEYQMTDDVEQLKKRIQELQQEYDRRLSNQSAATESSGVSQATPPQTSNAGQGVQSSQGESQSSNNSNTENQSRSGLTIDLPLLPPITLFGE